MKTIPHDRAGQQGHALLLAIVITGLIGFILVTYLTLVQSQNASVMRSQAWNSAMPILEAGVEEALAHINVHASTNLECDGWTRTDDTYQMTRSIGDSFYVVTITNYIQGASNNAPKIDSFAYVVMPLVLASAGPGPLLATAGTPASSATYLGRGVRVTTALDLIFVKGMVAKDTIDLNGNNIQTDSFDSNDAASSTNGLYVAGWHKANGDIASNASITNSVNVGNANIFGHVSTGPNGTVAVGASGSVGDTTWHANGSSGIQPGYSKQDMNVSFPDVIVPFSGGLTPGSGWITNVIATVNSSNTSSSATIAYPANPPSYPYGSVATNWITSTTYPSGSPGPVTASTTTNTTLVNVKTNNNYPAAGTYVPPVSTYVVTTGPQDFRGTYYAYQKIIGYTTNYTYPMFAVTTTTYSTNNQTITAWYDYILDDGNYQLGTLNGSVYVRGKAKLYVSTTLNMSALVIDPNKKLDLYCAPGSAAIAGNTAWNSDRTADSFGFWGLPTCTSVSFSGNAGFTGTIYAPNAAFTLNGGGNNTIDFIGASIAKSVTLNGHFNFHYDEALGKFGPTRGWVVKSWNEIGPQEIPKATVDSFGRLVLNSTVVPNH